MTDTAFSLVPLLAKVVEGEDLTATEAARAFGHIVSGLESPVRTGGLLAALQTKGLAPSEVAGGVEALRGAMIPVESRDPGALVDTCGTGGGSVSTFNISTASALVVAAAGVPVAKHGNRSFTSKCGSADVLEALGVAVDLTPDGMSRVLDEAGIVFMFAPLLHPAMRHVVPVRRDLGITTIMNLLGPLTNPARARRQVVGVADPAFIDLVVRALMELGHDRALVVYGEPGLDELSPCGPTRVAELRDGRVSGYEVTPEELGLDPVAPEALAGGEPEQNAAVVRAVLAGDQRGAARTAVLINAAAAFQVAGRTDSLADGVAAAAESIDSGAAAAALDRLIRASQRAAAARD
ncbi:MAG: anthranilate phosphoribosyltransferase [Gemmatimonadetes bacterium]|nr:anthranilate phosphoribosyltransferase [Gemmatimonadota bacterium]